MSSQSEYVNTEWFMLAFPHPLALEGRCHFYLLLNLPEGSMISSCKGEKAQENIKKNEQCWSEDEPERDTPYSR